MKKKKKKTSVVKENISLTYEQKVRQYLGNRNVTLFMNEFGNLCEKTDGRVSYEQLVELLGRDFPKASWVDPKDVKLQIIMFFNEIGIPFIPDDTHIYFP